MAPEPDEKERGQQTTGPAKGDFIASPEVADSDERAEALPQEEEFWRPPTRFGSVPDFISSCCSTILVVKVPLLSGELRVPA